MMTITNSNWALIDITSGRNAGKQTQLVHFGVGYVEGHLAGGFDQLKDVLALLLREYSAQHSA